MIGFFKEFEALSSDKWRFFFINDILKDFEAKYIFKEVEAFVF
jgi:hypothetical protein